MTKPVTRKMAVDCLLYRILSATWTQPESPYFRYLRCYICDDLLHAGQSIQFDHIHAIVHDGPHEYRNLAPVHAECHKKKTKADVQANAKVKRLKSPRPSKHPMKSSGRKIPSRPFPKPALKHR